MAFCARFVSEAAPYPELQSPDNPLGSFRRVGHTCAQLRVALLSWPAIPAVGGTSAFIPIDALPPPRGSYVQVLHMPGYFSLGDRHCEFHLSGSWVLFESPNTLDRCSGMQVQSMERAGSSGSLTLNPLRRPLVWCHSAPLWREDLLQMRSGAHGCGVAHSGRDTHWSWPCVHPGDSCLSSFCAGRLHV